MLLTAARAVDAEKHEMRLHERGGLLEGVASADRRSIRLVGEDPLLVRALERLLRNAGYTVGTSDEAPTVRLTLTEPPGRDVALTIVDLPDDRSEEARSEGRDPWLAGGDDGRVLWLSSSAVPPARASSCLAKPFSASQLLERVESLVPAGVG
jgi:DNA-binding response OmpR family regulator